MILTPFDRGRASDDPGQRPPAGFGEAKIKGAPSATGTMQDFAAIRGPGSHPPQRSASTGGVRYAPSFSRVRHRQPYTLISVTLNRLVSSPFRATPEYNYLYTAALVERSPPAPVNFKYFADNSYLLSSSSAQHGTAWPYAWRRSPLHQTIVTASRSSPPRNEPAATRDAGQKIDNGLRVGAALPRSGTGLWRPSPSLGEWQSEGIVPSVPRRPPGGAPR